MKQLTIGFIGAGNMASAMIGGLVGTELTGDQVSVFDPSTDHMKRLSNEFGVNACDSNEELVAKSDVVLLAIKPQVMQAVLTPLESAFTKKCPLIISIAAGIPCEHINNWLNHEHAVVRVMPNTPALVSAGASGLYANKLVTNSQKEAAETLLNAIGTCAWVETENDIDAVTALSGSGPAYFMLFVKSLIDAGIQSGLNEATATRLALQTCEGSAKLMRESNDSISQLIKNVTSPGGTTEQALNSFYKDDLEAVVQKAFDAALNRSKELANELK